jgi:hypothetical protein
MVLFWYYFRLPVFSTTARVAGAGRLWVCGCVLGRKLRVSKQCTKSKARLPCASNVTALLSSTCIIPAQQISTCTTRTNPTPPRPRAQGTPLCLCLCQNKYTRCPAAPRPCDSPVGPSAASHQQFSLCTTPTYRKPIHPSARVALATTKTTYLPDLTSTRNRYQEQGASSSAHGTTYSPPL